MSAVVKQVQPEQMPVVRQEQFKKPKTRTLIKRQVRRETKELYSMTNLAIGLIAGIFLIVVVQLWVDARINALHYEVENLKFEMETQNVANEELYSKIAELSTYSRAMQIANEHELKTQGNIVYIGE